MNHIAKQYKTSANLDIRIAIHAKYSTNPEPFFDWIAQQYRFAPNASILELGCGTAEMWKTHLDLLNRGQALTLTDLSPGMLETAKGNLPQRPDISYNLVDIQSIPYPDHSFDAVIANMMLYHVPDLHLGLSEVYRVLKPGGTFYCATNGENGVHQFSTALLAPLGIENRVIQSFTLQNGAASLGQHFSSVTRIDREDGLVITNLEDYVDYLYSLESLSAVNTIPRDRLMEAITARAINGVLYIPKEYGMFLCRK